MLLMTGFSTLVQMKDHPIIIAMVNNTHIYHSNWVRNRITPNNISSIQIQFQNLRIH